MQASAPGSIRLAVARLLLSLEVPVFWGPLGSANRGRIRKKENVERKWRTHMKERECKA